MKILNFIKDHALNILLPRVCHGCERDLPASYKLPLCGDCNAALREPGPLICGRCGVTLPDGGNRCYSCRGVKAAGFKCSLIRSALVFTPEARSLVHNFKYGGHVYLQKFLAEKMRAAFDKTTEFKTVEIICPVPLHSFKQRRRGYNQSALLAQNLAENKNIFYDEKLLLRKKNTSAQAKLKKAERIKNVENAFECRADVKGKIILLVDDVCTTGSTLEACAAALKAAKAKKVYALTLAREE
ncbi:MAG: ComF family protein [Elusimicrobium sp.]|jgi:ComF family protein|nr:ComF family protein [Elusimicrobium sp.]